jgi:SAM-dependent methyltransferase
MKRLVKSAIQRFLGRLDLLSNKIGALPASYQSILHRLRMSPTWNDGLNDCVDDQDRLRKMTYRWDKEWIQYFRRSPDYFQDCSSPNEDVRQRVKAVDGAILKERELRRKGPVIEENPIWKIWAIAAYPSEVRNKWVADLGCGPGGIGRTLGYLAAHYLGIDYSPLALHIAKLVSPPNCTYLAMYQVEQIEKFYSKMDIVFSRNVFIHQNFEEAKGLASLASRLLKKGGILVADFFQPTKNMKDPKERGVSRLAKEPLDPDRPSIGFYYTDEELQEVSAASSLAIKSMTHVPKKEWKLVRFEKL